jgi:hypothetical protein
MATLATTFDETDDEGFYLLGLDQGGSRCRVPIVEGHACPIPEFPLMALIEASQQQHLTSVLTLRYHPHPWFAPSTGELHNLCKIAHILQDHQIAWLNHLILDVSGKYYSCRGPSWRG